MKKIGIFGGTFNPIHFGHLILAETVLYKFKLDKIIFIPCNIPAMKYPNNLANSKDRITMLKKAIKTNYKFELSDIEIKRNGVSYTIDTLKEIKRKNYKFYFIIGEDNLKDFDKWKDPEKILQMTDIIVVNRAGYSNKLPQKILGKKIFNCEIPNIGISSTMIRRNLSKNLSVRYLLPDEVLNYIKTKKLYRD